MFLAANVDPELEHNASKLFTCHLILALPFGRRFAFTVKYPTLTFHQCY